MEIQIAYCVEADIGKDADYECSINVSNHATRVDIPFTPLAIPGHSWKKLHAEVAFEVLSDHELKVRFQGDTYSFRENFSALNVPARYERPNGEPLPEDAPSEEKKQCTYVRIIKSIDVKEPSKMSFLLRAIQTLVYENTIVAVLWKGPLEGECPVANFQKELLKLSNVYFTQ